MKLAIVAYSPAMRLKDWRLRAEKNLAEMARELGIEGVNPGATLARIENGSRQSDADMQDRIIQFTDHQVTANDLHEVRLEWLKANRPDKFSQDADNGASPDAPGVSAAVCEAAE